MSEETPEVRIARLEEKLVAAKDALSLAQHLAEYASKNTHAIVAEILALGAVIVSIWAVFRK